MKRKNIAQNNSYSTLIVLKCNQILLFMHGKKLDDKKYQQGANYCTLGTI
jgi:hypothetical protein